MPGLNSAIWDGGSATARCRDSEAVSRLPPSNCTPGVRLSYSVVFKRVSVPCLILYSSGGQEVGVTVNVGPRSDRAGDVQDTPPVMIGVVRQTPNTAKPVRIPRTIYSKSLW